LADGRAIVVGGTIELMQLRRLLAIGALTLATAACSGGAASAPPLGKICGVTASGGFAVGVVDPALLHVCPSGPHEVTRIFTLIASSGRKYAAYTYNNSDGWTASLPAGTYRAVNVYGCSSRAEGPFVVRAGKTTHGVVVHYGCLFS
jgi:hypothetical protein